MSSPGVGELAAVLRPAHIARAGRPDALVPGMFGFSGGDRLTAHRRPFLYFPLGHHFEQNFHVHRLERYRAGRRMDFDHSPRETIAHAIAQELGRDVDYLPVASDGMARAAKLIAELV